MVQWVINHISASSLLVSVFNKYNDFQMIPTIIPEESEAIAHSRIVLIFTSITLLPPKIACMSLKVKG